MASIFKVTVIQYWLRNAWIGPDGLPCAKETPGARFVKARKVPKGTPGAHKVKKRSGKWYGRWPGTRKPVLLSTNKVAARQLLAKKVEKAEVRKANIFDPFEDHRQRPLLEHLADWEASLKAKENTSKHVRLSVTRVRRLLTGCGFVFIGDLSAFGVQQYLAGLRQQSRVVPPIDNAKEWYTKAEAAASLGVHQQTFKVLVQRYRLKGLGQGKARRFPRATLEALQEHFKHGRAIQTANYYLREVKSFCRWLVKDRRMAENPLAHLSGGNARLDRRHDRRPLDLEDLRAIIETARQTKRQFRGLAGPDRAILYTVACASGFRAGELAELHPGNFHLHGQPPTVTLPACEAKNRKTAVQPLPPDVAETREATWRGSQFISPFGREHGPRKPLKCSVMILRLPAFPTPWLGPMVPFLPISMPSDTPT